MNDWQDHSLSGCVFEPPKSPAPTMSFAAAAPVLGDPTVPRRVDLRAHCTAVEDQGRTNSCTANAVVGAMEYLYAKRDGRAPDLSRLFVYYNTRRLNGTIPKDGGARISEAMAAALAYGACKAEIWPFDIARLMEQPPQPAYMDAMGHEAMQFARVPGVEGAVRALAQSLPVVFGCFLPRRCYDEAATTGRIPTTSPQERGSPPQFGHAMLLVGYDLPAKEFIVRNSWGPRWGDAGYCRLPFEEAAYFAPIDAFWVLASLEPSQGYKIENPSTAASTAAGTPTPTMAVDSPSAVFGKTPTPPPGMGAPNSLSGGLADAKAAAEKLRAEIKGDIAATREALAARLRGLRDTTDEPPSAVGPTTGQAGAPPSSARPLGGEWVRCQQCNGRGSCFYCQGTGMNMGYPCSACGQSRSCSSCGGTGWV